MGDAGTHVFSVPFETVGTQTVTATDTVTGTITGNQSGIVVNPAGASVLGGDGISGGDDGGRFEQRDGDG